MSPRGLQLGDKVTFTAVQRREWDRDGVARWRRDKLAKPQEGVVVGLRRLNIGGVRYTSENEGWFTASHTVAEWRTIATVPSVLVAVGLRYAHVRVHPDDIVEEGTDETE